MTQWQQQALQQMTAMWSAAVPAGARDAGAPTAVSPPTPGARTRASTCVARPTWASRSYCARRSMPRRSTSAARASGASLLRQVVDAMSPANCLATNPEAMQTGARDRRREPGRRHAPVHAGLRQGPRLDDRRDRLRGRQERRHQPGQRGLRERADPAHPVRADDGQVHERPLVIVPPCINKFYILDLQPDNSFVRYAVDAGPHGVPGVVAQRRARAGPPDLGRLPRAGRDAGDRRGARRSAGADRVNTLGFCVGGTLLATALAVMAARGEDKVASLTLLTTMLDFSDTGEIGAAGRRSRAWPRAKRRSARAACSRAGSWRIVFASLRANDLIWPYVVNSYLKGKAPPAFDLLYWNADGTNLPGPMYCWYLRNTYLENKLREPGKTVQCGVPVDLGEIDMPAYLYASREDHIVPWQTAYTSTAAARRRDDVRARRQRPHRRRDQPAGEEQAQLLDRRDRSRDAGRLARRPRERAGSWWPDWGDWLEAACRRNGAGAQERRQPQVPGHRTRPWALRQGKGRLKRPNVTSIDHSTGERHGRHRHRLRRPHRGRQVRRHPRQDRRRPTGRRGHQGLLARRAQPATRSARSSSARCSPPAAGQNPARQAVIKSGLPQGVPALTINAVCGSGLKAVHAGRAGDRATATAEIVIAGGQENMRPRRTCCSARATASAWATGRWSTR